ncbi:MAG: DUF6702 family protein [Bacteroidota bacterium]
MIVKSLILLITSFHAFHVSVTDIEYKEEKKSLQISSRIFLDDLEETLRATTDNKSLDITSEKDWDFVNKNLREYALKNIKLHGDKGLMDLNYIGAEIDSDVMWVYLEVEKVKKLKSIKVVNRMLMDAYEDQENIVHVRAHGKVKSARLFNGGDEELFEWEN